MFGSARIQGSAAVSLAILALSLTFAHAQNTPEQKAIYDAGYAKGLEAGKKQCPPSQATPIGTPGSWTTIPVPILSSPNVPGSNTRERDRYYFLVQQPEGLSALEFEKNAETVTMRWHDANAFTKLLSEGKLAAPSKRDHDDALKNYFGMYQQKLQSGTVGPAPSVVTPPAR